MVFHSFAYLLFFPIVYIVYFLLPPRVRYLWLLAASRSEERRVGKECRL